MSINAWCFVMGAVGVVQVRLNSLVFAGTGLSANLFFPTERDSKAKESIELFSREIRRERAFWSMEPLKSCKAGEQVYHVENLEVIKCG